MARLVLRGFPLTPAGDLFWCAVCATLAKGTLLAPQWEQIEAALADEEREVVPVGVDAGKAKKLLELAVTWGPAPLFGGAVVPVCWLHCTAVDGKAPPPGPADQQQQPGLIVPEAYQRRKPDLWKA